MLAPGGPGCRSAGPCHLYCTYCAARRSTMARVIPFISL